jgi:hypothetical protein
MGIEPSLGKGGIKEMTETFREIFEDTFQVLEISLEN